MINDSRLVSDEHIMFEKKQCPHDGERIISPPVTYERLYQNRPYLRPRTEMNCPRIRQWMRV